MATIEIIESPSSNFMTLQFDFNYLFVQNLKDKVPSADRKYVPKDNHIWLIHDRHGDLISDLACEFFDEVLLTKLTGLGKKKMSTVNMKTGNKISE